LGGLKFEGSPSPPQKKFVRPHFSRKKNWAWWFTSVIPATAGSINKRSSDPGLPGQKAKPYLQNNWSKKGKRNDSSGRAPTY
jgi:hypothetical protein